MGSWADLPSIELIRAQAAWLRPARDWLLGDLSLPARRRVLDLGTGYGAAARELVAGSDTLVAALDKNDAALKEYPDLFGGAAPVCGGGARLCFGAETFDLVFTQLALLWMPLEPVLLEVARVTAKGGYLVAIEPDYGGLIEHPEGGAAKGIWISALSRAGADPFVGRKLPGLLESLGYDIRINLFNEITPPSANRFDILRELPLTAGETDRLDKIQHASRPGAGKWAQIAHLPFILVTGRKQG